MTAASTVVGQSGRAGAVRVLTGDDLAAAIRILSARPIDNVFVASRVRGAGLEPNSLGCPMWGYERDGVLRSICHAGSNLVPVGADPDAIDAYIEFAGPHRMCSSIIGPADMTLSLWHGLSDRWGKAWSKVREVRPNQPVLAIDSDPEVTPNPQVRQVTLSEWEPYAEAAIKMYTEEVGVSPVQGNAAGYRFYVRQLISAGRAFGWFDGGRVLFKADLGSVSAAASQVQGVWLDPKVRGQGFAASAMAAVVQHARAVAPVVSLYVNDYNLPARAAYRRVGFTQVGEFATILY